MVLWSVGLRLEWERIRRSRWSLAAALAAAVGGLFTLFRQPPAVPVGVDRLAGLAPMAAVRRPLPAGLRGHQVRPSVRLRSGEARACEARVPSGATLQFAAALEGAPRQSALALEVRVDGKLVFERRLSPGQAQSFSSFSLPLEGAGLRRIEFVGRIHDPDRAAGDVDEPEGRVVLGSPRLSSARPSPHGRVLIWISQDTVRADHVGLYGYGRPTTPAIDRRAAEWVVFDEAVATAPWTLPSLVSQFTGRYPSRHGAVLDDQAREPGQATVFQALAAQGFTVLGVTANRFVSPEFGTADGFDALSFTPSDAGDVTQLALGELLENWGGGDLALFVHYMDAHFPYDPPPRFRALFATSYRGPVNGRNFIGLAPGRTPPDEVAYVRALYDAELAHSDEQIDFLLESLDRRGLLSPAVVVYSADHGEGFLDHGKWLHASTVYRELLRVPLAISAPGLRPRRVREPVSMVDLAPTLLDLLGVPAPASMQGRSLRPALEGGSAPQQAIFAETEETTERRHHKLAVRSGWLKYILTTARAEGLGPPREEVFDLHADSAERSPLPLTRAGTLPRLAQAFLAGSRRPGAGRPRVLLSPEDREALAALGYAQ